MSKNIEQLKQLVKERMNPHRFEHTEGVFEEIRKLGKIYLPNQIEELSYAALLHDVTKNLPNETQLEILRENNIPKTIDEDLSPQILHGWTASLILKTDFPEYYTPEIEHAIHCHTTGEPNMSIFDMLLFLADYIEEGRQHEACKETRSYFWNYDFQKDPLSHLDDTILKILEDTIAYLKSKNQYIAKATLDTYDWLKGKYNGTKTIIR